MPFKLVSIATVFSIRFISKCESVEVVIINDKHPAHDAGIFDPTKEKFIHTLPNEEL